MRYFVTATDTGSGKTLVSALLCSALQAAYWKPVQAGRPTDSEQIRSWMGKDVRIFPEAYVLEMAASPHTAAAAEGTHISLSKLSCPSVSPLIIEGAGGLLVPLNEEELMIDLISQLQTEVILVVNAYLGCINHALLSIEALRSREIALRGVVFNGNAMPESESIILKHSGLSCLLRIPYLQQIQKEEIQLYGELACHYLTVSTEDKDKE